MPEAEKYETPTKVLLAICNLSTVDSNVYMNHLASFYELGKNSGNVHLMLYGAQRMSIDNFRNGAAVQALATDCDVLLFLDDDMLLSPGTLEALIKSDYDVIMADTLIRSYPYKAMSFETPALDHFEARFEKANPQTGIADCTAVGFACCAIKVKWLKRLHPPYFFTVPNICTEDVYFCNMLRSLDPEVKIGVHLKYPTSHAVGQFYVNPDNKAAFLEFMEKVGSGVAAPKGRLDNTTEYHNEIMEKVDGD